MNVWNKCMAMDGIHLKRNVRIFHNVLTISFQIVWPQRCNVVVNPSSRVSRVTARSMQYSGESIIRCHISHKQCFFRQSSSKERTESSTRCCQKTITRRDDYFEQSFPSDFRSYVFII